MDATEAEGQQFCLVVHDSDTCAQCLRKCGSGEGHPIICDCRLDKASTSKELNEVKQELINIHGACMHVHACMLPERHCRPACLSSWGLGVHVYMFAGIISDAATVPYYAQSAHACELA